MGMGFWRWNMSNDMHPSHTYTMPGNYSVTLKITTDEGVSYSLNKYNLVHVETLTNPLNFVATPTFGTGPIGSSGSKMGLPRINDSYNAVVSLKTALLRAHRRTGYDAYLKPGCILLHSYGSAQLAMAI
jgi:FOG: PKD repeat